LRVALKSVDNTRRALSVADASPFADETGAGQAAAGAVGASSVVRRAVSSIDLGRQWSGDTPAAVQPSGVGRSGRISAVASVEQDDFVREVIDIFDATLIESSIKPV
jgi:hypothetical protein